MEFKPGVRVRGSSADLVLGLMVLNSIFEAEGQRMVVTSVSEGQHSPKSLHYKGMAADVRTRDIPDRALSRIIAHARSALTADYDLVRERSHLHLEHDSKGLIGL